MQKSEERDEVRQRKYRFDAVGYHVHRGFLAKPDIARARRQFARLNLQPDPWLPTQFRSTDIHRAGGLLGELAQTLHKSETIDSIIGYPARLLESYALDRRAGLLDLHGGGAEYLAGKSARDISSRSWAEDGQLYTLRAKVLIYLDDVTACRHGRLAYIEGSHKAALSFHRAFPGGRNAAQDLVRTVEVRAGDALWINEGLMHGAEPKTSAGRRRLLAYTFGPTFMADWRELEDIQLASAGYVATDVEISRG